VFDGDLRGHLAEAVLAPRGDQQVIALGRQAAGECLTDPG
jgi:hypothetical protein